MLQIIIILTVSLAGQFLSDLIPFPIPKTILSSFIIFLLLELKILKVTFFKDILNILRKHLAFFFLPVGVGIMTQLNSKEMIDYFKILFLMIVSTFLIMLFTGKLSDMIIDFQNKFFKISNLDKEQKNERSN